MSRPLVEKPPGPGEQQRQSQLGGNTGRRSNDPGEPKKCGWVATECTARMRTACKGQANH